MLSWLFSDPLPTGTRAPDFTALDDAGKMVTLAQLRGKNVILVFYPGDNTPVCRAQLCEMRDEWSRLQGKNAVVFGINPAGASSHESFRQKNKLPFPLLVDAGQNIAKAYNADGWIVKRTVYLIDPEGVIRFAERGKPSAQKVLAAAR